MIITVDNLKEFHTENIQEEWNKEDYTYLARFTKATPVWWLQRYGARVHFQNKEIECPELTAQSQGNVKKVNLRYGIVAYNDMLRDLTHWESLISSTFMMRPHSILTEHTDDKIIQA